MSYVAGVGSEVGRVGGFKDYIAANSQLEIVTTQYSNADMPTALNQTTDVLTANPDLVGIFGANEPTAIGMGQAIKNLGLSWKDRGDWFRRQCVQLQASSGMVLSRPLLFRAHITWATWESSTPMTSLSTRRPSLPTLTLAFLMVTQDNIDSQEAKNVLY